jgi:hypothetical protein
MLHRLDRRALDPNACSRLDDEMDNSNLRRVLVAAAPMLTQPLPLPPLLETTTLASVLTYLSNPSDAVRITQLMKESDVPVARPAQGGERITVGWLNSLKERDCRWRFRYRICLLDPILMI